VFALKREGASVTISARRTAEAVRLADELGVRATEFPPAAGWDLLVNTTPIGTWPAADRAPIERAAVRGGIVYDLVYNPEETQLLAWAREAGAEAIGGLEMLVGQAGHQFAWWTGQSAPTDVMAEAARAFVRQTRE
jgi:shikimate 5-dehydrogenase